MSQSVYDREGVSPADLPRYTLTSQVLHWVTSACILAVLPFAWVATNMANGPAKGDVFTWHKSFGLTILGLVIIRLLWRSFNHAPPEYTEPTALKTIARVSHWLLYAIFIVMPVSGFLLSAAHGYPTSYFFLFTIPPLEKNDQLASTAESIHLLGQWAVYALVGLHILATAWHVALRRDYVLERMLPEQDPATLRRVD